MLVLLLVTYRSPVIALVPLVAVAIAYLVAAGVVYALVEAGAVQVTGQTTAILIVLMFGAGTDYCLLLVARYREEARRRRARAPAAHAAGDPLGGRDRVRRDARARPRRLPGDAHDGTRCWRSGSR